MGDKTPGGQDKHRSRDVKLEQGDAQACTHNGWQVPEDPACDGDGSTGVRWRVEKRDCNLYGRERQRHWKEEQKSDGRCESCCKSISVMALAKDNSDCLAPLAILR